MGDELSIRIVEADKCDPPKEVRKDPPEEVMLREKKQNVRRIFKELGWKIVVPKK